MERLTQKIKDHMQGIEVYIEKSRNIEINTGGDDFQDIIDKLAYYENLEEQGLLHKAPVPNGTPIYFVRYNDWLEEDGVHSIEYIHGATENLFGEINKDWFLTEEEAEAKFEQIKDRF